MATPEAKKIIQCSCGTKLSVPVSASRVMCPKCKQPLQVAPAPAMPSPPSPISASPARPSAPPPVPPPVPTGWFVALGKTKLGPLPRKDVAEMLANGRLQPSDMVLPPGTSRWTPAHSVEDLRPVTPPRSSPKTSKKWLLIGGIAGASFLLVGIVLFLLLRGGDSTPSPGPPISSPENPSNPARRKKTTSFQLFPS